MPIISCGFGKPCAEESVGAGQFRTLVREVMGQNPQIAMAVDRLIEGASLSRGDWQARRAGLALQKSRSLFFAFLRLKRAG